MDEKIILALLGFAMLGTCGIFFAYVAFRLSIALDEAIEEIIKLEQKIKELSQNEN